MPLFKSGPGLAPSWCTMEFFEIVDLVPGTVHVFSRTWQKEKLLILSGRCLVSYSGRNIEGCQGDRFSLENQDGEFSITQVFDKTNIIRIGGRWRTSCNTFGMFTPAGRVPPREAGDPVDYPKSNNMDSHFHDCDEYWIIYEGKGVAVSEGTEYKVGPGDCVATGRGHHHDFPVDIEPVQAVYFETDLEGDMRTGHLWEWKHGKAEPVAARM